MKSFRTHVQTLVTGCTVSVILPQIDYTYLNWPFLTLNLLYSDSTSLIVEDSIAITPRKLHDAKQLGSTSLLLNNVEKCENSAHLIFLTYKMTFQAIQSSPSRVFERYNPQEAVHKILDPPPRDITGGPMPYIYIPWSLARFTFVRHSGEMITSSEETTFIHMFDFAQLKECQSIQLGFCDMYYIPDGLH